MAKKRRNVEQIKLGIIQIDLAAKIITLVTVLIGLIIVIIVRK